MKSLCCMVLFFTIRLSSRFVMASLTIDWSDSSNNLAADSPLGRKLLSQARRLEQGIDNAAHESTLTWLSGYSIKFQACHHIQQWNDEVDDKSNVRIKMKRLVRFRLCPSHACTSHNTGGCLDGYGDYIIDLQSFMDAYFEATKQATDYECNKYYNKNCNCDYDDEHNDKDHDQHDERMDAETCAYDCYAAAGLEKSCTDRNPHYYDDAYQIEEFEPSQYMECARFHWNLRNQTNDSAGQRFLQGGEADDASATYYIGPFCRHQGGTVMLGMFTDDTCSQFADENRGRDTFRDISGGLELPYSRVSLIGSKCISCLNQDDAPEGDQDDDGDDGQKNIALDACQSIYSEAGKCELRFGQGVLERPNTSACRYIQGIKNVRQDGIATGHSGPNGIVNLFIVLFAVACAALGQYIQYLRKILKHKKIARALLP
mmetsp:Transcript_79840/g.156569  ORF Transcript_79840/g.156569 Transcript_79840/m.156569 type:complete len:430 (-) Transcript_79840:44-1333(-)